MPFTKLIASRVGRPLEVREAIMPPKNADKAYIMKLYNSPSLMRCMTSKDGAYTIPILVQQGSDFFVLYNVLKCIAPEYRGAKVERRFGRYGYIKLAPQHIVRAVDSHWGGCRDCHYPRNRMVIPVLTETWDYIDVIVWLSESVGERIEGRDVVFEEWKKKDEWNEHLGKAASALAEQNPAMGWTSAYWIMKSARENNPNATWDEVTSLGKRVYENNPGTIWENVYGTAEEVKLFSPP